MRLSVLTLGILLAASPARAESLRYDFGGTILSLDTAMELFTPDAFVGETFSATLEFVPFALDPTRYIDAVFTVTIGEYIVIAKRSPFVDPTLTRYTHDTANALNLARSGMVEIFAIDWTTLPGIFAFGMAGPFADGGSITGHMTGSIDSVREVPEPSTTGLLILGAVACVASSHRRLRRSARHTTTPNANGMPA